MIWFGWPMATILHAPTESWGPFEVLQPPVDNIETFIKTYLNVEYNISLPQLPN